MKNKKDFKSFLEDPRPLVESEERSANEGKLIKRDRLDRKKTVEQVQWNQVAGKAPDVSVIENDGRIEAIEFKCSCGCGAVVQFDYDDMPSDQVLN